MTARYVPLPPASTAMEVFSLEQVVSMSDQPD